MLRYLHLKKLMKTTTVGLRTCLPFSTNLDSCLFFTYILTSSAGKRTKTCKHFCFRISMLFSKLNLMYSGMLWNKWWRDADARVLLMSRGAIRNLWNFYQKSTYNLFTVTWSQLTWVLFWFGLVFFSIFNPTASFIAVLSSVQHLEL